MSAMLMCLQVELIALRRMSVTLAVLAALAALGGCASQDDIDRWNKKIGYDPVTGEVRSPEGASKPRELTAPVGLPRAQSLSEAMAAPDESFSLELAALLFAQEHAGREVDVEGTLRTLERWRELAFERTWSVSSGEVKLTRLRRFINDELGLRTDRADPKGHDPRNLFLDSVISRKRGYCVTLSIIWLSLARACGIEARGVGVPGHFLVLAIVDGQARFIESTDDGRERRRSELIDHFLVAHSAIEQHGAWLTPLSDKRVVSVFFNNLGGLRALAGDVGGAVKAFDEALRLSEGNLEARYNRAALWVQHGSASEAQAAMRDLNRVVEVDPNFYYAFCWRGMLYSRFGEKDRARTDLRRARAMRPELPVAHVFEGMVALEEGNVALARTCFEAALKADKNDRDALRNLRDLERAAGNAALAEEYAERHRKAGGTG